MNWDTYFLLMAEMAAMRSKDPSTKVGAVLVLDNRVLSMGYNGFPAGFPDTSHNWQRPLKYEFVVHAEMNALLIAAKNGVSTDGATLYTSFYPCDNCCKHIAAAGIKEVVYNSARPQRANHHEHGGLLLHHCRVDVRAQEVTTNHMHDALDRVAMPKEEETK